MLPSVCHLAGWSWSVFSANMNVIVIYHDITDMSCHISHNTWSCILRTVFRKGQPKQTVCGGVMNDDTNMSPPHPHYP